MKQDPLWIEFIATIIAFGIWAVGMGIFFSIIGLIIYGAFKLFGII